MNKDLTETHGACHCGTVQFHVRLTDRLNTARRCNCSYCRMRGAAGPVVAGHLHYRPVDQT